VSSEVKTYTSLGVCIGTDWQIYCHAYPGSTPILSIRTGAASLDVSAMDRKATEAAVRFARELARQVQRFAAETERICALQQEGNGKAAEGTAA
jgi:hypothetical protein